LTLLCLEYFSNMSLSDLPLSEQTLKAVKELGFSKATEI
jgi:superfamily II DNA/RNA helicase